jgi:hypothetical protein
MNERLLIDVVRSKPAIPLTAITCHSVAWPEYPKTVDPSLSASAALM